MQEVYCEKAEKAVHCYADEVLATMPTAWQMQR